MTDLPATKVDLKSILSTSARVDNSEGMSYLQSVPRRMVTLYLPLAIIVFILLFPFYWMGLTAVKPDNQLLDLDTYNPFWTWNPTLKHFHKLLFESYYPHWLWNTMYVAVCATVLSIIATDGGSPELASAAKMSCHRPRLLHRLYRLNTVV